MSDKVPVWKQRDPRVSSINSNLNAPPAPEEVSKHRLPFGIYHLDLAMKSGVNVEQGDYIIVQGPEKNRKSTLALNMALYWAIVAKSGSVPEIDGRYVVYETLESAMGIQRIKDIMGCMLAHSYMAHKVYGMRHDGMIDYPTIGAIHSVEALNVPKIMDQRDPTKEGRKLFTIGPNELKVMERSLLQQEALEYAKKTIDGLPLIIFGAPPVDGYTRVLQGGGEYSVNIENALPYARWLWCVNEFNAFAFFTDHLSAYRGANSFDKMNTAVKHSSTLVAEQKVVKVDMLQYSLTAQRSGEQYGRGGKTASEEASCVINVKYDNREDPWHMYIDVNTLRGQPPPLMKQPLEPFSGKFIGRSVAVTA